MIKSWIFELPSVDLEAPAPGPAYDWFLREWDRAEALNFEGVFLSEHHLPNYLSQSPNILLAAMAMRTSRIRMGVMALTAPMYHPSRLAEEISMLDHLCKGRLEIGLARGANPVEVGLIGMPAQEMQPRLLEALDIIEGALTASEPFSYDGQFYKCKNLVVPRTLQQPLPPRWLPTATPESAALAARRGYKTCGAFLSADRIAENFDVYRAAAVAAGRVVGPDDLGIRRIVIIDEDGDKARSHIKDSLRSFGPIEALPPWFSSDEVVAGTPDEVARNLIGQCERTGAGHVLIYGGWPLSRPVFENTVELYGRDVLPVLRGRCQ
jgi:alkanesulfonate monooxygenase SsuD/methylene tetrahydromethanopterin reductase-like flavin-dependent oxidoreductase (luciferase family)